MILHNFTKTGKEENKAKTPIKLYLLLSLVLQKKDKTNDNGRNDNLLY